MYWWFNPVTQKVEFRDPVEGVVFKDWLWTRLYHAWWTPDGLSR